MRSWVSTRYRVRWKPSNWGTYGWIPRTWAPASATRLFEHAVCTVRSLDGSLLTIVSDPHAEGFYQHMGAQRAGQVPSMPPGRRLPRLTYAAEVDHAPGLLEPSASKAPQKGP